MPLNRITCPECGAGLKSASGFTPGRTVSCPKCETDFVVEEPDGEEDERPGKGKPGAAKKPVKAAVADVEDEDEERPKKKKKKKKSDDEDGDGEEWSYKNSWIRYAILGVLLIVLGVLAYLLYQKKQREAEAGRDDTPAAGARFPLVASIPGAVPGETRSANLT